MRRRALRAFSNCRIAPHAQTTEGAVLPKDHARRVTPKLAGKTSRSVPSISFHCSVPHRSIAFYDQAGFDAGCTMSNLAKATEVPSVPPTLAEVHSGIPDKLLHKARRAKALILETRIDGDDTATKNPRRTAVPPGVSDIAFRKAIDTLRHTLGLENVELVDGALKDGWYMEHTNTHDMMSVLDEEAFVASAVVYPGSVPEVQKVVRWANEHLIPIWPISMGRNLGYGGAAPRVRGSVVVDLGRRMNRILNINRDDYTCLLEPGVSFYALHEEVEKRGYGELMWVDTPDMGGGSVIGNTLDRGVGYTPYGDHWATHSGLEVVLPTGEVVRTGMGAMTGSNTWQTFPYGFGPVVDGLFSQSNMGIVTKMGMTLMPNPGGHESFVSASRQRHSRLTRCC